jgi:hypothetical protein
MRKPRRLPLRPRRWHRSIRSVLAGLAALEFLERSRDMADDPVTSAPRPVEVWPPPPETATP